MLRFSVKSFKISKLNRFWFLSLKKILAASSNLKTCFWYFIKSSGNSPSDEIKIFVDNTRFNPNNYDPKEGNKEVGIHFYDVKSPTKVKIQTQNKTSEYLIEQEQILFVDLDNPKIDIIINDAKLDISDLNSYPITEIKIDDNNEWDYIKKHGTSKLW